MHQALSEDLLQMQVAAANQGPVRSRLDSDIRREGTRALARTQGPLRRLLFELDGPNYDAEPLRLRLRDADTGEELAASEWPLGLGAGPHPSLERPFTCMQGLFEYHCHHSHLDNPWDRHRYVYRLEVLLGQLLDKAGL